MGLRAIVSLPILLGLVATVALAQQPRTFTVQVGQEPWYDRAGQWALVQIPEKYISDRPVPQQSCTERSLVLPAPGAPSVLIGVLAQELAEFLRRFPALTDTGDRLAIGRGGSRLEYAICLYSKPPQRTDFSFSTAGVILLSWGGELPATNTPPPTPPAPASAAASQAPTYTPANHVCPWYDRQGRWEIQDLPEQFQNGPPVPLQSCERRNLVVPPGTTKVTLAVFEDNLPGFRQRFPGMTETGLGLRIASPGTTTGGLSYKIIVLPVTETENDFRDITTGGIVLLRLEGVPAPPPAQPTATEGVKGVLQQDQEFVAQEYPLAPGERRVKMWVQEPPAGISPNTGLMLVLHNWGGEYNQATYQQWCRTFSERFNVIAISVNYLHSGPDWKNQLPYDHGYLQAMDAIGALYMVRKQLKEAGVAFNEHRIYAMGGSGGGNVTQMAIKLAPHTFACGVDICGMPGLIDAIAYGTGEGTSLNAGYSRDPSARNYLSPDMQRIRDFGDLEHCRLLARANPDLVIVIVHGVHDNSCPVVPKIRQYANMIEAGLRVDAHFLTERDVDGKVITTTGHAVGDREQVVIKFADEYMREDGPLACATTGPNDFERGGTFEYPTQNGRFVIDYTAYPLIKFVAN